MRSCLFRTAMMMAVALIVAPVSHGAVLSTFDTDTEDWAKLAGSDASSVVQWNAGGYMQYSENGTGFLDFVSAPAKFLGDQSAAYGHTLSFDIMTSTLSNEIIRDNHVRLIGDGITLRYALPSPSPANQWHSREIDLVESSGWINEASDLAPTQADMLAVLSNLSAMHFLTDYRSGPEVLSFDNVTLVPEPASVALLGLGMLMLRRRRPAQR